MRAVIVVSAALFVAACGSGDTGSEGDVIDASGDSAGDPDSGTDASGTTGTQEAGQFCETQPEGGPFCVDGLECCEDKVCRTAGECDGSTGFIPCECTDDCNNSFICCESPDQTFCTKRSGCDQVDGTEVTTCP